VLRSANQRLIIIVLVKKMRFRVISKSVVLFLALFLLLVTGCLPAFVRADQSSASSELASTQSKLVECFNAAKAAEAAGANISELTSTLNVAGSLFSHAELAYSSGNFSGAEALAVQSQNELSNFVSTASSLQSAAAQKQNIDFYLNFVAPIVGAVAVVVGSFLIWVLLKRKYGSAREE
jgi:hypothetical protein